MRQPNARARSMYPAAAPSRLEAGMVDETPLPPSLIDGSLDGVRAFLVEMAGLLEDDARQDGAEAEPVLALLLGDVLTVSSVTAAAPAGLAIFACLPAGADVDAPAAARSGCKRLWHAERGCVVLARTVPLADLRDEPGVFDAILDTAGLAARLGRCRDGSAPDGGR